MLYKFKSRVTGDLIMLQPNGQRILRIIGLDKPGTPSGQGILLPEQIPGAIAALQAAVAQEEAQRQAAVAEALAQHTGPPQSGGISLRLRAHPFIEMLRRCEQAGEPVMWGV